MADMVVDIKRGDDRALDGVVGWCSGASGDRCEGFVCGCRGDVNRCTAGRAFVKKMVDHLKAAAKRVRVCVRGEPSSS
jgi:hypothetical protein